MFEVLGAFRTSQPKPGDSLPDSTHETIATAALPSTPKHFVTKLKPVAQRGCRQDGQAEQRPRRQTVELGRFLFNFQGCIQLKRC
jgi:hypothetical protein